MNRITPAVERTTGHLGSVLVLLVLVLYTYANFFVVPYPGFQFNPSNRRITDLDVNTQDLKVDDRLVQVGPVTWETYDQDLRQPFFEGVEPGEIVPILIERDGELESVRWEFPVSLTADPTEKIPSTLLFSYLFWLVGLAPVLLVRPVSPRSRLLTAFLFLTAVWTAAGDNSLWHLWESAILLRVTVWLCVPVYLHLHWEFPRTLRHLPKAFWWGLYSLAGALAVAQWFQIPDKNAYLLGFVIAVGGSVGLLLLRLLIRPAERQEVGLLLTFSAAAFIPLMLFGLLGLVDEFPNLGRISLLTLPLLPMGYFYAIFRRQMGGLENRINRALVVYQYGLFVMLFIGVILGTTALYVPLPNNSILLMPILATIVALLSVWLFPRFRNFIERRFLNIPLPPTHLVERYAARITTSLDRAALVQLLRGEILASLLVRESALYHLAPDGAAECIYAEGITAADLPSREALSALQSETTRQGHQTELDDEIRPIVPDFINEPSPVPWARLVLPLQLGGELSGLWLLGRRDPDDYYTAEEISILETLANQTAVALQNILQKERLQSLFQANIDRHEEERARLARYLHDDVLNELVVLGMQAEDTEVSDYDATYQLLAGRIRQIIHGLRPSMLNYGLQAGIQELADGLSQRAGERTEIQVSLPPSETRYPRRVEEQLFRITQQACENTLQHAEADFLFIEGRLAPEAVTLSVVDDGAGFEAGDRLNLNQLLAEHHYGIAGMIERAALIGAQVRVASRPGRGTRVDITWEADGRVA